MSKADQSFSYTGSSTYSINNVVLSNGAIALFDSVTGVGGVDYVPYNGSTVTVVAGSATGSAEQLAPTLNNKLYYLVSDTQYSVEDKSIILAAATEIPVVYSGGVFTGQFVFSNPNNYDYVYLLWDYEDKMDTVVSYKGETSSRSIAMNFRREIGRAGINFNTIDPDQPTRYQVEWNGQIVIDTKYVGLNSLSNYNALISAGVPESEIGLVAPYDGLVNNGVGSAEFYKYSDVDKASLIVSSPFTSSTWIVSKIDPYLKSFYISEDPGIPSDVCAQCPDLELFHNGSALLPIVGDVVFATSDGSEKYVGDSYLHLIDRSPCFVPPVSDLDYVTIGLDGSILSKQSCTCSEFAVPFIISDPITVDANTQTEVVVEVINNPTSWDLLVSSLPTEASFSNGILTFINCPAGAYSVTLRATNCFGSSSAATISITVVNTGDLEPVLIDVEQFKESGADACLVIPTYTLLYFAGSGYIPQVGDTIYYDSTGLREFMGGKKWYQMNNSDYTIQIDQSGIVIGRATCAGTTTTTTTTSTTTLPAGSYYSAASCADPSIEVFLRDTTAAVIVTGNVVKTADGNCWRVLNSVSPSFPYYNMLTPVVVYADCTACTGTTTTTTTTSTTTAVPVIGFDIDITGFTTSRSACTSSPTYITYYHTGGSLAVNEFVYIDAGATTLFDGGFLWYLVKISGVTYACLIADTGQVLQLLACSGVTTTTTTTTIPVRYYSGTECVSGDPVLLSYQGFSALSLPNYVKDSTGDCCRITAVASPGTPKGSILYVYNSCSECAATTTTTTTTSTTTTTTSTTTTTTTTAAPLFVVTLSYSLSQSSVCSSIAISNYYINGAIGIPGNNIFTDMFGSDLAPAGWYLNLITNVAYEWDGSDWTGASKTC